LLIFVFAYSVLIVYRVLYARMQISEVERKDLIDGRVIREVGEKTVENMGKKMERKVAKAIGDAIFRT
jgi:uncharacterized protein YqeY